MDGRGVDISLADADKSIYKLSDRPAETIRRPHRTNDAWEVIKKGSWKLVSFFIWQTRSTGDRLKGQSDRKETTNTANLLFWTISLLCGYTFIKNQFQCLGWYVSVYVYGLHQTDESVAAFTNELPRVFAKRECKLTCSLCVFGVI